MDAVLPLTLGDYERSLVLRRSLARFFEGLGTLFVVAKASELEALRQRMTRVAQDGIHTEVICESEVVPELDQFRALKGWYKQQLVKLAIFERVSSDFYLTLDADVIATRRITPELLAPEGRALLTMIREPAHSDWYRHSGQLLGKTSYRPGLMHNVTPAVLAKAGVRELSEYLTERWKRRVFRPGYRGLRQRWAALRFGDEPGLAGWRLSLAAGVPWTEYALYYGYLEQTGRLEHYHRLSDRCLYDVAGSVWKKDRVSFATWNPAPLFEGEGPPYFVVVQSNTRIAPELVLDKLAPYLTAPGNREAPFPN